MDWRTGAVLGFCSLISGLFDNMWSLKKKIIQHYFIFLSFINHNYEKQNKWIKFSKGFLLLCKSSIIFKRSIGLNYFQISIYFVCFISLQLWLTETKNITVNIGWSLYFKGCMLLKSAVVWVSLWFCSDAVCNLSPNKFSLLLAFFVTVYNDRSICCFAHSRWCLLPRLFNW